MLAPTDIPAEINALYEQTKALSRAIAEALEDIGEKRLVKHETDLLREAPDAYCFVTKGFFKFFTHDKLLRFYSDGDFVLPGDVQALKDCRILSEMASEIIIFPKGAVTGRLAADAELAAWWRELIEAEMALSNLLSSLFLKKKIVPNMNLKRFAPGEVILKEGEEPNEICLLFEGEAQSLTQGVEVGEIYQEEIFGEMEYLTGQKRSTTVIATKDCLVQSFNPDEFYEMIQSKPLMIEALLKTLANRVILLNRKVSSKAKAAAKKPGSA